MREPADAFQFVGQQKTCVHSDPHSAKKAGSGLWLLALGYWPFGAIRPARCNALTARLALRGQKPGASGQQRIRGGGCFLRTVRRVFVTNLALVLVLNLLVKPFYILGIDAAVQGRAGTEAYGGYAALLSLSFLLNILLDVGITNWNTRHVAQHTGTMRAQFNGVITIRALLVVLYAVVIFIAAFVLGYRGKELGLLAVLVLNQTLVATILFLRSNIAGAQKFAQDSLLSVLDRVLLIGICAWLLWGRGKDAPFPIIWFAWAQTVAYAITALVALSVVVKHVGLPRPQWNTVFVREVLRQCAPYALLVLLMTFYYRTDTVMIERLLPDGKLHAGIYAQGFRFFEAFNMLGFLLAGLLLPMFSRMLKHGEDIAPLSGLAVRLVIAGTVAVAVIGSFYAKPVMDLRYHEHTLESAPAFAVLIWSFVAVCVTYVFGTLLTASGDLRTLNRMAAGGMALNILLNLVLIPRYQALGAAWAGFITQGLMAITQAVIAARRFHLRPTLRQVLSVVGYVGALVALAWLAVARDLSLPPATIILSVAALGLAGVAGLLPLSGLRSLLVERKAY
jgi:O-antigen/teichoic acid export membrane protein